jgi:hypothetical protein
MALQPYTGDNRVGGYAREAFTLTFFTFDEDQLDPDESLVLGASSLLQITEFQLFELAYERWFGAQAPAQRMEGHFCAYMFGAVVPLWVRQYCREVLDRDRVGTLDPRDFGVLPRQATDTMLQQGVRYALTLLFVLGGLHLAAFLVAKY